MNLRPLPPEGVAPRSYVVPLSNSQRERLSNGACTMKHSSAPEVQGEPQPLSILATLADRCEGATGPDTSLSHDIGRALDGPTYRYQPFTFSVDAALTLVPEGPRLLLEGPLRFGWEAKLRMRQAEDWESSLGYACAATPALAICAAALRARIERPKSQDSDPHTCPVCGEKYGHAFNCSLDRK